jgi:hypothetical protein
MTTKKTGRRISVIILVFALITSGCNNGTTDDPPNGGVKENHFYGGWWAYVDTDTEKVNISLAFDIPQNGQPGIIHFDLDGTYLQNALWIQEREYEEGTYTFNGNTADISLKGITTSVTIGADDKFTWQGQVYARIARLSGTLTVTPENPTKGQTLTANYSGSEPITYEWRRGATVLGTSKTQVADQAGDYWITVFANEPGYNPLYGNIIVKLPKPVPLDANASYSQTVAKLNAIIEYCTFNPTIVNNAIKTSANGTKNQITSNPAAWDTMGTIQIPIINDEYIAKLE